MGPENQIILFLLNHQIVHGDTGKVLVHWSEVSSCIEGQISTSICAHHPPPRHVGTFHKCVHRFSWQVCPPPFPRLAFVPGGEHPSIHGIVTVAVQGNDQKIGIVMGPTDFSDPEMLFVVPFADGGGHGKVQAGPVVASILGDVHEAVVASCGKLPKAFGMLRKGGQRSKGDIAFQGSPCEVWPQGFPVVPAVERAMQLVGAHVQHVFLMLAEQDGGLPIPAQGRVPEIVPWMKPRSLACRAVGPLVPAKLIACVHDFGVPRIHRDLHAIPAAQGDVGVVTCLQPSLAFTMGVRPDPSAVVLEATINVVGGLLVHCDRVELSHRGAVALDP